MFYTAVYMVAAVYSNIYVIDMHIHVVIRISIPNSPPVYIYECSATTLPVNPSKCTCAVLRFCGDHPPTVFHSALLCRRVNVKPSCDGLTGGLRVERWGGYSCRLYA